jgi:hypothetical protein
MKKMGAIAMPTNSVATNDQVTDSEGGLSPAK